MRKDDCIFCKLSNGVIPVNALYEDEVVKAIFDLSPASKGHVIIMPKNHAEDIFTIDEDAAAHLFLVTKKIAKAMKIALKCDGINILQNNGEVAGQSVFHFHMHIIPRYKDDNVTIQWNPGEITEEEVKVFKEIITENMRSL